MMIGACIGAGFFVPYAEAAVNTDETILYVNDEDTDTRNVSLGTVKVPLLIAKKTLTAIDIEVSVAGNSTAKPWKTFSSFTVKANKKSLGTFTTSSSSAWTLIKDTPAEKIYRVRVYTGEKTIEAYKRYELELFGRVAFSAPEGVKWNLSIPKNSATVRNKDGSISTYGTGKKLTTFSINATSEVNPIVVLRPSLSSVVEGNDEKVRFSVAGLIENKTPGSIFFTRDIQQSVVGYVVDQTRNKRLAASEVNFQFQIANAQEENNAYRVGQGQRTGFTLDVVASPKKPGDYVFVLESFNYGDGAGVKKTQFADGKKLEVGPAKATFFKSNTTNKLPSVDAGDNVMITIPEISYTVSTAKVSDVEGLVSPIMWKLIKKPIGAPNPTITNGNTLEPTFSGLTQVGVYTFRLFGTDNAGATQSDTMSITVSSGGEPPIVEAGKKEVVSSTTATFVVHDATANDVDGQAVTSVFWSLPVKPEGSQATIVNGTTLTPTFNGLTVPGRYHFRLNATAGNGLTGYDAKIVIVQ